MANDSDASLKALLEKMKALPPRSSRLSELAKTAKLLADEEGLPDSEEEGFPDFDYRAASSTGTGTGTGGRGGVPALPARTKLDLSKPTVNVPNVPEFTIPGYLSVTSDSVAVSHPGDLSQVDWLIIARNSRILYAYTMGVVAGENEPPQANKAALDWMVPDSHDFLEALELGASVVSEVTYTAETASYVRAGVDKEQASAGFPFAAASFEREHKERQAGASYKKQLQLIGRWYFPRVKLKLKYCAAVSDRFTTAIRTALDSYDKTSNPKPLLDVFADYGTAVPDEIILGGQMFIVHQEDYQGNVSETEVENVISAAVELKTTKAQGTAGASFQNASGSAVTADQMSKLTKFTVRGGDSTLASNPASWPATVKPPSNWAVIGRSGLTSIVDWLPDDLRARTLAVWPKLPVPPAVWDLQDTFPNDHVGRAERAQFVLGARSVAGTPNEYGGAVQLVCGTSLTPELGRGDAVGGAASFHLYRDRDVWTHASSVCLPVPAGYRYSARAPNTFGAVPVRFAIAETNLTLDQWRPVDAVQGSPGIFGFQAPADGFVFCSIEASKEGDRGYAVCQFDRTGVAAAAAVHYYPRNHAWMRNGSFCVPFTKGTIVGIKVTTTAGQPPIVRVWQTLSTSRAWKFTKPEPLALGTWVKANTDGFVNGVITVSDNGPRGVLRLDCAKERGNPGYPIAAASVHVYHQSDRFISHASTMLPVRKDYWMFADFKPTSGVPQALAYWTGVVPAV